MSRSRWITLKTLHPINRHYILSTDTISYQQTLHPINRHYILSTDTTSYQQTLHPINMNQGCVLRNGVLITTIATLSVFTIRKSIVINHQITKWQIKKVDYKHFIESEIECSTSKQSCLFNCNAYRNTNLVTLGNKEAY